MKLKYVLMVMLPLCAVIGLACVVGCASNDAVAADNEFGIRSQSTDVGLPKGESLRLEPTGLPPAPSEKFPKYEKVGLPPAPAKLDYERYKGLPQKSPAQKTFKTYPKVLR